MRAMLLAVLFVGWVTAQDTPQGEPKLIGNWTVVSGSKGGEKAPEEDLKNMLVTIDDKNITIKLGKETEKAAYKADATAKPATIDLVPAKEPDAVRPGIYELKGDDLKIAWNKGEERSKDFKGEGKEEFLLVLKRKK